MKTKIPLITIGLDLGDKKHAICVLNQDGEIIDERTITNHRESLRRLSQKHFGAHLKSRGLMLDKPSPARHNTIHQPLVANHDRSSTCAHS